jgi:membrane protease YdiL (CAAX protease family)
MSDFGPDDEDLDVMPRYDRQAVLAMTLWAEIIVLIIAVAWTFFAKIDLRPLLVFNLQAVLFGALAALLVTLINLAIMHLANKYGDRVYLLRSMKDLINKQMLPLIGNLSFGDSIIVALVSGLCEEFFFRGVLQTQCGIIPSACAFGLAHLPRIYYFPYALWATYVGLLMSFLTIKTGSLFSPMIAHALINFASINVLRRLYKSGELGLNPPRS